MMSPHPACNLSPDLLSGVLKEQWEAFNDQELGVRRNLFALLETEHSPVITVGWFIRLITSTRFTSHCTASVSLAGVNLLELWNLRKIDSIDMADGDVTANTKQTKPS